MDGHDTYLDRTIGAVQLYAKLNKGFRRVQPDYGAMRRAFLEKQEPEARQQYDAAIANGIVPFAQQYLARVPGQLAHSCHAVCQGFYETWTRLAASFPLNITIGDVSYRGESLYHVSKSSVKRILNEGNVTGKTLDVHVWLTFDDLTVIDPTILPTLKEKGLIDDADTTSDLLIWREDDPGDFEFEPILIDNEFFQKVDSGRFR